MGLDPDTNGLSPFLARSLPSCSLFLESSFLAISFISFVSATPILLHFFCASWNGQRGRQPDTPSWVAK